MKLSARSFLLCVALVLTASSLGAQATSTIDLEALDPSVLPYDLRSSDRDFDPFLQHPGAWCPSEEGFTTWLEERRDLPSQQSWVGTRGSGGIPNMIFRNGVVVIEDDGTLVRNDDPIDLPLQTIEFVPNGSGYTVSALPLAYETGPETPILVDQRGWAGAGIDLTNFTFPFGGQDRTRIWALTSFALFFDDPPIPPETDYLCTRGCFYDEGEILIDRTPRVAPLHQGRSAYGWNISYREEADRVVFTWTATDGGALNVDVQTVLYADGRIRFNYAALSGFQHGAPSVVTGNQDWWSDRTPSGSTTDPAGDVTIPAPDGPPMDLTAFSANQIAGSELLQVEFTMANPLPPTTDERVYFAVTVKDEETDTEVLQTIYYRWDDGAWTYQSLGAELIGTTLRFNLNLLQLPLADTDLFLEINTFHGESPREYGDTLSFEASFSQPTERIMLDLSTDLPVNIARRPIFEAFTLPELIPSEVHEAMASAFPDLELDGLAIYQNFDTDIIFYAGGYSTAGNAGADGIGRGSSQEAETPALLHVNNIYRYGPLDWAMTVLTHEFAHRWLYFIQLEENGNVSYALNPGKGHPAAFVHMPAVEPVYKPQDYSCMGGSWWTDNGNGTFTSEPVASGRWSGFNWNELYLMGLAGPWEVPDSWYIANSDPPLPDAYWPESGITVTGDRIPFRVEQIVAAEGPRFPPFPDSRMDFVVPTVLVIRPGVFDQAEIDAVAFLCEEWKDVFPRATGWRASVRCALTPPDTTITTPSAPNMVIRPGTVLTFRGEGEDADADPFELSWNFAGVTPDASGQGPHTFLFPEEGTYEITLSAIDSLGMCDPTPASVTVEVDCGAFGVPADEVQRIRVARPDEVLIFGWEDLPTDPSEYVLLRSANPQDSFLPVASAPSGNPPGLLHREMQPGLIFYQIAPLYDTGCMGPF